MNMDVSIIIVNYKTVSLILKCLNSIQRLTRKISYEIIVVDNNSNDDFATYIQQQYPKVKCVSLPENMGLEGLIMRELNLRKDEIFYF